MTVTVPRNPFSTPHYGILTEILTVTVRNNDRNKNTRNDRSGAPVYRYGHRYGHRYGPPSTVTVT